MTQPEANQSEQPVTPARVGILTRVRAAAGRLLKRMEALLAFIAIIFATIQFVDSRRIDRNTQDAIKRLDDVVKESKKNAADLDAVTKQSEMLANTLKEVADKLSTKYLGVFPMNLAAIKSMLASPGKEIRILCDYPGYGHYSQADDFDQYKKLLIAAAKRPGAQVRLLYYGKDIATRMVTDQFSKADWAKIQQTPSFAEYFRNHPGPGLPPATYDGFVQALLDQQRTYEQIFCNNGIEIEYIDAPLPLFFWLSDSKAAVFSINSRDEKGREETFFTSDGKLTDAFMSIFDRMWQENASTRITCGSGSGSASTR